jgi:predicted RNase H-like HicB family nuclease
MRYTIILQPWDDEKGYTVIVPALPGCVTQGSTKAEALANAKEAILCHIEGLKKAGETVPEETSEPELASVRV